MAGNIYGRNKDTTPPNATLRKKTRDASPQNRTPEDMAEKKVWTKGHSSRTYYTFDRERYKLTKDSINLLKGINSSFADIVKQLNSVPANLKNNATALDESVKKLLEFQKILQESHKQEKEYTKEQDKVSVEFMKMIDTLSKNFKVSQEEILNSLWEGGEAYKALSIETRKQFYELAKDQVQKQYKVDLDIIEREKGIPAVVRILRHLPNEFNKLYIHTKAKEQNPKMLEKILNEVGLSRERLTDLTILSKPHGKIRQALGPLSILTAPFTDFLRESGIQGQVGKIISNKRERKSQENKLAFQTLQNITDEQLRVAFFELLKKAGYRKNENEKSSDYDKRLKQKVGQMKDSYKIKNKEYIQTDSKEKQENLGISSQSKKIPPEKKSPKKKEKVDKDIIKINLTPPIEEKIKKSPSPKKENVQKQSSQKKEKVDKDIIKISLTPPIEKKKKEKIVVTPIVAKEDKKKNNYDTTTDTKNKSPSKKSTDIEAKSPGQSYGAKGKKSIKNENVNKSFKINLIQKEEKKEAEEKNIPILDSKQKDILSAWNKKQIKSREAWEGLGITKSSFYRLIKKEKSKGEKISRWESSKPKTPDNRKYKENTLDNFNALNDTQKEILEKWKTKEISSKEAREKLDMPKTSFYRFLSKVGVTRGEKSKDEPSEDPVEKKVTLFDRIKNIFSFRKQKKQEKIENKIKKKLNPTAQDVANEGDLGSVLLYNQQKKMIKKTKGNDTDSEEGLNLLSKSSLKKAFMDGGIMGLASTLIQGIALSLKKKIVNLASKLFNSGATKGIIGKLFKSVGGPLIMSVGGILANIPDMLSGIGRAKKWGTSKFSAALGGFFGGYKTKNTLLDKIFKGGTLALAGAGLGVKIGSLLSLGVGPLGVPVGAIVGGLGGLILGTLGSVIGGEKIAKGLDTIGKEFEDSFKKIQKGWTDTNKSIAIGLAEFLIGRKITDEQKKEIQDSATSISKAYKQAIGIFTDEFILNVNKDLAESNFKQFIKIHFLDNISDVVKSAKYNDQFSKLKGSQANIIKDAGPKGYAFKQDFYKQAHGVKDKLERAKDAIFLGIDNKGGYGDNLVKNFTQGKFVTLEDYQKFITNSEQKGSYAEIAMSLNGFLTHLEKIGRLSSGLVSKYKLPTEAASWKAIKTAWSATNYSEIIPPPSFTPIDKTIKDGIVTSKGVVVQTHPDDNIIATKNQPIIKNTSFEKDFYKEKNKPIIKEKEKETKVSLDDSSIVGKLDQIATILTDILKKEIPIQSPPTVMADLDRFVKGGVY